MANQSNTITTSGMKVVQTR